MEKTGQNWKRRTASDLTAPRRSLTASRGLWRTSAPSMLGFRLAQSHHHPGAQRPPVRDRPAPQRSLTASRGLWRTSAPSRLGLRLAQSHHHPGAQRPRSEIDQLEEQQRVRHCSSELHMKLPCLYSRKDRELKKWCLLLSEFNPFVPSVPKTMTPSKS